MVNFIWFINDKLLKFYHCNYKNRSETIAFTRMWR